MNAMQNINRMEELRTKYRNTVFWLAIPFVVLMFCIFGGALELICIAIFLISAVCEIVIVNKLSRISREFQQLYKDFFAKGILDEIFTDVQCNWREGYSEWMVDDIGLTKKGNRFSSEDYIRGRYEDVPFEQSDVVVRHVVRSGKQTHTYTYFRGRIFTFEFPKTDICSVVVFSKSFMYQGNCGGISHKKVEMESGDFNKRFIVKAVQSHDAFYVLTPQVMECISNLEQTYGNVAMRYIGGKVHVAVNMAGDAFDGNINKKVVYVEEQEKIRRDCNVIIDMIHKLKL